MWCCTMPSIMKPRQLYLLHPPQNCYSDPLKQCHNTLKNTTYRRAAHNYDGDMLTDEVAQVHRSPGFITSSLLGKTDDDIVIKEFEASHGTVSDLWHAHNRGEETSMNPLGMVRALLWEAMRSAAQHITSHHIISVSLLLL